MIALAYAFEIVEVVLPAAYAGVARVFMPRCLHNYLNTIHGRYVLLSRHPFDCWKYSTELTLAQCCADAVDINIDPKGPFPQVCFGIYLPVDTRVVRIPNEDGQIWLLLCPNIWHSHQSNRETQIKTESSRFRDYIEISPPGSPRSVWFSRALHHTCIHVAQNSGCRLKEDLLNRIAAEILDDAELPRAFRYSLTDSVVCEAIGSREQLYVMHEFEVMYFPELGLKLLKQRGVFHDLRISESEQNSRHRVFVSTSLKYRLSKLAPALQRFVESELFLWAAIVTNAKTQRWWETFATIPTCVYSMAVSPRENHVYFMLQPEWPSAAGDWEIPI